MQSWNLKCFPGIYYGSDSLNGDQIIIPNNVIEDLYSNSENNNSNLTFTLKYKDQEISATMFGNTETEDHIYVPDWIFYNFGMEAGENITLSSKTFSKGELVKVRAHSINFLGIDNHKLYLEQK